jgi:hypothetical protein
MSDHRVAQSKVRSSPAARVRSFVPDLKRRLEMAFRPRRFSAAERRAIQQSVAKDPDVNRALNAFLASNPHYRRNGKVEPDVRSRVKP